MSAIPPVRLYEMGEAAYERAATDEELAGMQAGVGAAMAAGAIGFATSASPTHNGDRGRPVPSRVADLDELAGAPGAAARCRPGGGGPRCPVG